MSRVRRSFVADIDQTDSQNVPVRRGSELTDSVDDADVSLFFSFRARGSHIFASLSRFGTTRGSRVARASLAVAWTKTSMEGLL